jgi:carboxylesterase type B
MLRSTAVALSLYFGLASCASNASAPTVQVKNGTYVGVHSPEYNQDFFLGMPYAQPPVGNLRFRNPVPLNTSWSDSKPATQYSGEVCVCCFISYSC